MNFLNNILKKAKEKFSYGPEDYNPKPKAPPNPNLISPISNPGKFNLPPEQVQPKIKISTPTPTPQIPRQMMSQPKTVAQTEIPGYSDFYFSAKEREKQNQIPGFARAAVGIFGQESSWGQDQNALMREAGDVGPLQINDLYAQENPAQTVFNLKIPSQDRKDLQKSFQFMANLFENYYRQGIEWGFTHEEAYNRAIWKYNGDKNYLTLVNGRIRYLEERGLL